MKYQFENDQLILFPEGKVDSTNAPQLSEALFALCKEHPAAQHVLDLTDLSYISSAGLRVILRLRQEYPELRLVNASNEVYEILEMTGFTEMLPVERAKRRLSVEGCDVLGIGANGTVYRLDPETILKVYYNPDSLPDIERERELAKRAFVLGINTAIPYDVVRVGETYGSVFELLNAETLAERIAKDPGELDACVKMYVDLLREIHATELKVGEMPDMKEVALNWVRFLKDYLPAEDYEKVYSLIEAVPFSNHMMHGDYHLKNVMLQNGEAILIDMDTLCMGNPVFEFASMYLSYLGYSEVNHQLVMDYMGLPRETTAKIWDKALRLYFEDADEETLVHYANRARIVGYVRMMRRTIRRQGFDDPEGRALIERCAENLHTLLSEEDHLIFD